MEQAHLREMDGHQLLDTLRATAKDLDFAEDFAQVYETILTQAKEKNDLSVLLKAQNLRWEQMEYLTQQWLKHYPKTTQTHDLRDAN